MKLSCERANESFELVLNDLFAPLVLRVQTSSIMVDDCDVFAKESALEPEFMRCTEKQTTKT